MNSIKRKVTITKKKLRTLPIGKKFSIRDVMPYYDESDERDLSEDTSNNPLVYECALILEALGCKVFYEFGEYCFKRLEEKI